MTLLAMPRVKTAQQARKSPNANASPREILPRGIGRRAVRVITASMSASYHMFSAPAAPAPTEIARIAINVTIGSIATGAVIIPTKAVNTARNMTRGFIRAKKSGTRVAKRTPVNRCGRGGEVAVIFMLNVLQRQGLVFARSTGRSARRLVRGRRADCTSVRSPSFAYSLHQSAGIAHSGAPSLLNEKPDR